ncbi:unknown [Ruminococcus sp. CAG:60]|nr:unknown [Ruminococcus sp. CAG:60]
MNHIIPDGKLCKILDSLSIVGFLLFLLFLFFLLLTENICFRDHRKLDQRILKAFPGMTVHYHNLAWMNLAVIVLSVKSIQVIFPKVLRQSFRPGTRTRKQGNLVTLFLIFLQILHKKLEAAVVGGHALHGQIKFLRSKIPLHSPRFQCRQRNCPALIQFFLHFGKFTQPLYRKILLPLFLPVHTALAVLFLYAKSVFQNTVGLIQKQQCFFPGKIIREGYQPFAAGPFHCRIDGDLVQVFQGPLALRVKASNGIYFVSPQLDSPGILFCQAVNIHNSAPHGKLSRHFHLAYPLVAQIHQRLFQKIHIDNAVPVKMQYFFADFFQGHQVVHTAVNACDNSQVLLLQKRLYHTHSLANQQISLNICLEKQKILRRIKQGILIIKAQVLEGFLRLALISCDYKAQGCFAGKSMDQVRLLGLQTACDLNNSLVLLKAFFYFFKFCHPLQGLGK